MTRSIIAILAMVLHSHLAEAQSMFPQERINKALKYSGLKNRPGNSVRSENGKLTSAYSVIEKMQNLQLPDITFLQGKASMAADTIMVGDVPGDTLIITGNWTHDGPIWVFNDGVLIFDNASVTNTNGDLIVFQDGKVIADSSDLFFPQQYFYERGFIAVQNAGLTFNNCNFNFSGMSHNLLLADSAHAVFNNIHHNDWTTCGLFGAPTLSINGCNLAGEYILSGTSQSSFINTDTLLLWHYLADSVVLNYSFPPGDTVYNYAFNNSVTGVDGVGYNVTADSCHNVMWALMPVNGSDVTISNSSLRAIGNWFERGDTANVYGIFNNSNYTNYTVPLSDRSQNFINSYVQTWSMYVFDSSSIFIDSCQLGEVGTQQSSTAYGQNFLLDGSGGYFWSTDSSGIIATNVIVYTTVRSERKGIFVLAYSFQPFVAPSAIGESVLVCAQNILAGDPVPYSNSTAWLQTITQPDTAAINSVVPLAGSAWIDQGPLGSFMDFGSYSLYYASVLNGIWLPLVVDSASEIRNNNLAMWNTQGLAAGDYLLKLVVKNNLGDSVESFKPIVLLQQVPVLQNEAESFTIRMSPNPVNSMLHIDLNGVKPGELKVTIRNVPGSNVWSGKEEILSDKDHFTYDIHHLPKGIYFLTVESQEQTAVKRIIKQ